MYGGGICVFAQIERQLIYTQQTAHDKTIHINK